MICTAPVAMEARRGIIKQTQKTMLSVGVNDTITRLLLKALTWTPGDEIPTFIGVGGTMDCLLNSAIESQTEIGWEKAKQGFISNKWTVAQEYFISESKGPSKDWKSILVRWMIESSWKMWEERNQTVHGNTIKEARKKKIQLLQDTVLLLYIEEPEFHTDSWMQRRGRYFA